MRIVVYDGNSIASRFRHAQKYLTTSDGRRSGVVYGFLQNLAFIKRRLCIQASQIYVVWDGGRSAFRKRILPGYKCRPDPDDANEHREYVSQTEALYRNLNNFGIRGQIRVSGVEADDLVSALTRTSHAAGHVPVVYTSDRDLHQLADVALIFDPVKEVMAKEDVIAFHQVQEISQIPLLKSMCGDDSDKIPGITQIGPKRAVRALPHVSNFFGVLSRPDPEPTDEGTAKIVQKVKGSQEIVRRNLELITLPKDFESVRDLHAGGLEEITSALAHRPEIDHEEIYKFLNHWECHSLDVSSF